MSAPVANRMSLLAVEATISGAESAFRSDASRGATPTRMHRLLQRIVFTDILAPKRALRTVIAAQGNPT